MEPAVAEGAGGESEAEEDCDIAEPAPKMAARDKEKGCAKCRWKPKGLWAVPAVSTRRLTWLLLSG